MERVPVEIWQQILLKAMETDDRLRFMTSCTSYTFLYFVDQQIQIHKQRKPYLDYLEQRRRLRLVCRTWNEFVLITSPRWLHLDDKGKGNPMSKLDSTTLCAGGDHPIERLSTVIASVELAVPVLSRVSHVLKRPAARSPLRAYALRFTAPARWYNPFDDLVGTAPKYIITTLQSLAITTAPGLKIPISLPQISSTFTGLRSLVLIGPAAAPNQTVTLPNLELLYVDYVDYCPFLTLPVHTWNTPSLRHAYLAYFGTAAEVTAVLDGFLRRYASQIESLVLLESPLPPPSFMNLPADFWEAFSALQLLGMKNYTLERQDWAGWTVVPPTAHPLRYLVCWSSRPTKDTVNRVRPRWTYHQGVKLVVARLVEGVQDSNQIYHIVKDVRDGQWIAKMEETCGILPES